jgi:hypothetical protein
MVPGTCESRVIRELALCVKWAPLNEFWIIMVALALADLEGRVSPMLTVGQLWSRQN